jgi:hypothetical protein
MNNSWRQEESCSTDLHRRSKVPRGAGYDYPAVAGRKRSTIFIRRAET